MTDDASETDLAHAWLAAANDDVVREALDGIYAHVAKEIEARGPVCWASGRCCNFDAAGHRLYATGLETAYTLVRARESTTDEPAVCATGGLSARAVDDSRTLRLPTLPDVAAARARGGCPFQSRNLCTAHAIKPLGCRVYFCDRSAQDWQRSLHEAALADVRALHDLRGIPYRYMEWRAALEMIVPEMG